MVKFAIEDQSSDDMAQEFIGELETIVEAKFNLIKENISLKVFCDLIISVDQNI